MSAKIAAPLAVGALVLLVWETAVRILEVPPFVLPAPSAIAASFAANAETLFRSAAYTLGVTLAAFAAAVISGVGLAVAFSRSRIVELSIYPYAVILQVTPVVAIAPLILIWVGFERVWLALLILAWIVAFFPVLSNATLGFRSVDPHLRELFSLYGATRWQTFTQLEFPSALPFILSGMKIAAGLALIGAVVAEFVAGSGASTGLAWRIIEAGNRLQVPKMFAALALLTFLGLTLFFALTALEHLVLRRWHESALRRER